MSSLLLFYYVYELVLRGFHLYVFIGDFDGDVRLAYVPASCECQMKEIIDCNSDIAIFLILLFGLPLIDVLDVKFLQQYDSRVEHLKSKSR